MKEVTWIYLSGECERIQKQCNWTAIEKKNCVNQKYNTLTDSQPIQG